MIRLNSLLLATVTFTAVSFVFYGLACLYSKRIRGEFLRYRLARYRSLVGVLQLAGAAGLFVGLWLPSLGVAAALGLAVLMAMGLGVRIRLRDTTLQMTPAMIYMLVSICIAIGYLQA